jgi:hypothetical protein
MGYFDNLDNEFLNKYKKNLKNEKKKFHAISLSFDCPSNFHAICNGSNLTFFDGLPNNNEII